MMKGDELNKKIKEIVKKYKENLEEYILDLYYEEKYEDLRSEIEIVNSLQSKKEMKLKEIKEENIRLSEQVEVEVKDKDLRDMASELQKIVEKRKDMEGFEYLLRRHYVKSNKS